MIAVGDVIRNWEGYRIAVTHVERGLHGLLVKGTAPDYSDATFETYILPELVALQERTDLTPYYGWSSRASVTLANGVRVGSVCFSRSDSRQGIEEHEAEWERTIASMKPEMGVKPFEVGL